VQIRFQVNKENVAIEVESDEPLLWALRDACGLNGPKFGCGAALCGSCTVLVDGQAIRSCVTPAADVAGKSVTTIEGLSKDGKLHPVQEAWLQEKVPQCGYCQCGQIMAAVALLKKVPKPSEEQIEAAMSGNICRCGTYPRIVKAIRRASEASHES
jgi:isoquinoline 1-oxidoreductase alpha subunit